MMMEVDSDMEKLYMPSNWVKRVSPEESVPLHVQITRDESFRVRGEEKGELGVRYGPQEGDWLDLYNEEGPRDLVAYLTGGYWQELSGELSSYPASPLIKAGHPVAIINYTRAPKQNLQDMQTQVERAGAWLVKWGQSKGKKVWLIGHSAGSHLCAMLLSSPWYDGLPTAARKVISGVVHLAGVFKLSPLLHTSVAIPGLNLTRSTADWCSPLHPDLLAKLSRSGQHLVTMIVVGQFDSPAFHQQAEDYATALEAGGLRVLRTTQAGEDHFSLVEKLAKADYSLTRDLIRMFSSTYN